MHLRHSLLLLASLTLVALPASSAPVQPGEDPGGVQFFEKQIRPVLVGKCYKCHSADAEKLKGGLLLDAREGIRHGGDSGHAVVPGDPQESLLIRALRYTDKEMRMPPEKSGGKLPDDVIKSFETWVKMGAPDPRDGASVAKKGPEIIEPRKFWAFQPPRPAPVPRVQTAAWPRSEIDRFLLAGLEQNGIRPVADAEPRILLRRLHFDVVGLPPAPEQVEAFVRDPSPSAFAKTVDRLLASPQFGERWARHWLDVARFAESTGRERNFTFPEAWRYRDYVIAAFNADKPYDQFIREQIAGDLLPAKDDAERQEHLIATGFLALGPKGLNEKNREQFRMDLIDEQIDATSRAVLGLTVACARCHDHKFDPIPQRDYYALAGIFRSTETRFGTRVTYGKQNKPNRNGTSLLALEGMPATSKDPLSIEASVPATQGNAQPDEATAEQRLKEVLASDPKRARKFANLPPKRKAQMLARFASEKGGGKKKARAVKVPDEPKTDPQGPQAMGVVEGRPSDCRLLVRGEIDQPGETIPRGFVTVLTSTPPALPLAESGRRELAEWLVAPGNPLTARVMVNRVWAHLFGQGLVPTADNFGASGEKPSHPEMLDFLAVKFSAPADRGGLGWSVKRLIRALVLSRVYQLSSAIDPAARDLDPDNRLLWRATPRRLDAEALRDAMLAASGQLDLTPGERSIVATVGDGLITKGIQPEIFTGYQSAKRSVYLPIVRDFVPEVLDLFDFAEPSLIVAARDVTNVPSQALFLMNNPFVRAQASALARRVLATPVDYPERIRLAYRLTLSRPPTEAELSRAQQFLLGEARGLIPLKDGSKTDAADSSWSAFCQALFACAEFRYLR